MLALYSWRSARCVTHKDRSRIALGSNDSRSRLGVRPPPPPISAAPIDLTRALQAPAVPPGARHRLQRGTIVPTEAVLFRLLFSETESLAKLATAREAAHLDAGEARNYFAEHAGLSMGGNGAVFAIADDYYGRVQQHDQNAKHEIEQFRAALKSNPAAVPPADALRAIEAQRKGLVLEERARLASALGPD